MSKPEVSLHIERIVLDGLPVGPGSAAQIQIAVQNELTRLLTQNEFLPAGNALPAVAAPGFQIARQAAPAEIGRNIAQSVFESLKRST